MYAEAIAAFQRGMIESERHPQLISSLGHTTPWQVNAKRRKECRQSCSRCRSSADVSPYLFAVIYAGYGDREQTLAWLRKALQERTVHMIRLSVEPQFDFLRNDPEFQNVIKSITANG